MLNAESILVFAPHHDDEAIGPGGVIRQWSDGGKDIFVTVVTSGYSGVSGVSEKAAIAIREKESEASAKILGVRDVSFLRLRDHALQFSEEYRNLFIHEIRRRQPSVILLPHEQEMDRDHRIVNELGREAAWLATVEAILPEIAALKQRVRLMFYEVWTPMLMPNQCVAIDDVWEEKRTAIEQHRSQLRNANYVALAEGLNRFRAVQGHCSGSLAEAFRS